jgi:hypothetical protein
MAGRYGRLVRYGRECAHKSSAQAAHSSLRDYMHGCTRFNINKDKNVLISRTREMSAVADFPSNPILSGSAPNNPLDGQKFFYKISKSPILFNVLWKSEVRFLLSFHHFLSSISFIFIVL